MKCRAAVVGCHVCGDWIAPDSYLYVERMYTTTCVCWDLCSRCARQVMAVINRMGKKRHNNA